MISQKTLQRRVFFFPVMKKHFLAAQVYAVLVNFVAVEGSENKNLLKGTQPSSRPGMISWTEYHVLSTDPWGNTRFPIILGDTEK